MKRLLVFILFTTVTTLGQQRSATTITLGLFTTQSIHSLVITPLGGNAWRQNCATCPRMELHSALDLDHIEHPMQLGGKLRLQPAGQSSSAEAAGIYTISPTPVGLRVTLQFPSESYVAAVLSEEAAPDEPKASLEALAITARTFALANLHRHKTDGFDLCYSTHCQALRLGPIRPAIAEAVRDTAGITLWSGSHRASIYYTQHCGGISEDASGLWRTPHASYLTSHIDPYCLRRSPASWQTSVPLSELAHIASEQRWNLPAAITEVRVIQHTGSSRAKLLQFSSSSRTEIISASSLRFGINRALGWNRIRSDLYAVRLSGHALLFIGHGYGHGVGLCQAGAFQMAKEHHTAAEILAFYFPSAHPGLTPSGELWHAEKIGDLTLRSAQSTPEITRAAQRAWKQALTLFPPTYKTPQPIVTVAPTTELFRQLTASPGYLLASTRGDEIILQPLSVLRPNSPLEPLLLHELLHTLIESESTKKAPLWLREGLAKALAGDDPNEISTSSLAAIEQALAAPPSLLASQQAHHDAETIVRRLGRTYSLTVMRRWLQDGVPPIVLSQLQSSL